jgi:chloramphenicol 3-O-phosphotransferase
MQGIAIVISGLAGAGKSTLCRALVNAEPGWVHVEADRCLPQVHESVYADERVRGDLVLALHESIAAYTARGFVALVDGSLPAGPEALRRDCLEALTVAGGGRLVRVQVQIDRDSWDRRNPDARAEAREWRERQLSVSATRSEEFDLTVDAQAYDVAQVVKDLKALVDLPPV